MANTKEVVNPTKVITDELRWSYLHAFEPAGVEGSDTKKYSVSLIIPKSKKALIAKIRTAIDAAIQVGKTKSGKDSWGGKVPPNLKMPLRDGDTDRPDDEVYANSYFLNASAPTKPGIVFKNEDGELEKVTDTTMVYSGCYGKASINFYPFNKGGSKGIACGLNNLQFTRDGEPLGGRSRAEDDFSDDENGEL